MKFSVILPLYNKAPYVSKAIKSVFSQTCTDYELVIMDDGSSDGSFEVAEETIKGVERCRIYRQSNAGASMARNHAVSLSKGDYVCFLGYYDLPIQGRWHALMTTDDLEQFIEDLI